MNSAMRPTKKCKCSNNVDALLNKRTLISTIGYWFYKFQYYYYLVYYLQIPFQTMDICVYIYIYIYSQISTIEIQIMCAEDSFLFLWAFVPWTQILIPKNLLSMSCFWAVRLVCSGFDSCCNYCNYNIIIQFS